MPNQVPLVSWRHFTFLICALIGITCTLYWYRGNTRHSSRSAPLESSAVKWEHGVLKVPMDSAKSIGMEVASVKATSGLRPLRLTGRLAIDPNTLVHVNSRFPGEVVSVNGNSGDGPSVEEQSIGIGQRVEKGDLLATIWSKDIGEKKSDLVDALSQLYLHQAIYSRLSKVKNSDAVPQRTIDEVQRNYESDVIQVERVRRTLASWNIPETELEQIEKEALRIHQQALELPPDENTTLEKYPTPKDWANVELRAPISGMVLERNMTVGDIIGTDEDLFKIADVSKLRIMVDVYEEDLNKVLRLKSSERKWEIYVNASESTEPIICDIEYVGHVIDPNQHTALLQGTIENSNGDLRAGQFIEAIINVPEQSPVLEIPTAAILDNGEDAYVLLRNDDADLEPKKVKLLRRTPKIAWVGAEETGLKVGDLVVTSSAIELFSFVDLSSLNPVNKP